MEHVIELSKAGQGKYWKQSPKEKAVKSIKEGEVRALENVGLHWLLYFQGKLHALVPGVLRNL